MMKHSYEIVFALIILSCFSLVFTVLFQLLQTQLNKQKGTMSLLILCISLCIFCVCFVAFFYIYSILRDTESFDYCLTIPKSDALISAKCASLLFQVWYFANFLLKYKKHNMQKSPLMSLLGQSGSRLASKWKAQSNAIKQQFRKSCNLVFLFCAKAKQVGNILFFSLLLIVFIIIHFMDEKVAEVRGITLLFSIVGFVTGIPLVLAFATVSLIAYFVLYLNWLACQKISSYELVIYENLTHDCVEFLVGNTPGSARVAAKQLGNQILPYAVGAFGGVVGIVIVEDAARDQMARHDAQVEIESTKEMGQTPRSYGEMREQYRERSISRVFVEKGFDLANALFKSPPKHSK